jgi:hypothetical protein
MKSASTLLVSSLLLGTPALAQETQTVMVTMDNMTSNQAPSGFSFARTGEGALGTWLVKEASAGGKLLAQTSAEAVEHRFPIAVLDSPSVRDVAASVRLRPVSGNVALAAGLVFRYLDDKNYYVAMVDAKAGNVSFSKIRDGKLTKIAEKPAKIVAGEWKALKVGAEGSKIKVSLDGQLLIETVEKTFDNSGKVGTWTKSDTVAEFDDLEIATITAGQ